MNKEIKLNLSQTDIKKITDDYPSLIFNDTINGDLLMSILVDKDVKDLQAIMNYSTQIKVLQYAVIEKDQELNDYKATAHYEIERLLKQNKTLKLKLKLKGSK